MPSPLIALVHVTSAFPFKSAFGGRARVEAFACQGQVIPPHSISEFPLEIARLRRIAHNSHRNGEGRLILADSQ